MSFNYTTFLKENQQKIPCLLKLIRNSDIMIHKKTENGWRFSKYDSYKLVVEKFQEKLYEQLNGTQ